MPAPRVFISYATESESYREWVEGLATRLRRDGVDARLDIWHLRDDRPINATLAAELREAEKVLVLCSPGYRRKVHRQEEGGGSTGPGIEAMLLGVSTKVVLARSFGSWEESAPDIFRGYRHVDLSEPREFDSSYRILLQRLFEREPVAPAIGEPPRDLAVRSAPTTNAPCQPPSRTRQERAPHPEHAPPPEADLLHSPQPSPTTGKRVSLSPLADAKVEPLPPSYLCYVSRSKSRTLGATARAGDDFEPISSRSRSLEVSLRRVAQLDAVGRREYHEHRMDVLRETALELRRAIAVVGPGVRDFDWGGHNTPNNYYFVAGEFQVAAEEDQGKMLVLTHTRENTLLSLSCSRGHFSDKLANTPEPPDGASMLHNFLRQRVGLRMCTVFCYLNASRSVSFGSPLYMELELGLRVAL